MNKNTYIIVLFLAMVAFGGFMAGCGQEPTSTTGTGTSLTDAINSDSNLFDVGSSDTANFSGDNVLNVGNGFSILSSKCYSWYRIFNTPTSINITILTSEATSAEVCVTREVTGILSEESTNGGAVTYESFTQDLTRYLKLVSTNGSWKISQVTQGLSQSIANGSGTSVTSDITIDSVTITSDSSGQTFALTQNPSNTGPWIDYSNILTTEASDVLHITVVAEGNTPYVYIWPDLNGTSDVTNYFFRHRLAQITFASNVGTYSGSFEVPTTENSTSKLRSKRMTIGVFNFVTLNSTMGVYDFTSWHIPYRVE
jgi:hypothetical protein